MKIIFTAIALFLFSASSFSQMKDTLYWTSCYKLRWDDFQGTPDTALPYEALTFSGIECKYEFTDTSFTYNVAAFFLRNKSWRMLWADSIALKHEQLHFDISEIFARALTEELARLIPSRSSLKQDVRDCLKKIIAEKEDMQNLYDEETNFGRINICQKKWEEKLGTLLNK